MSELLDCLKKVELFSDMPEKCLLTQICACGSVQLYMKEQLLFAPQQKVNRLGVVLSGKVRLLHLFPDGNYSLMSTVDAGGVIGAELACTRTQLAPYHAVASADTEIFWLPVTVLMQQGSLPETHRLTCLSHLLTMIAHENIKREYRLAILAQKSLRERILVYLTMQANRLQLEVLPCETTLYCDETLVKSMLYNLLDNAVKASAKGGRIVLHAGAQEDGLCFSVRDYGIGMSPEAVARAVEPFYMEDKSRSRKAGGAGLGLALCAEIARIHGGELNLRSAPGEGTLVTVTLPFSPPAKQEETT